MDLILHAGDIITWAVIEELSTVAPVEAVYGNMDFPEVRRRLKRRRIVKLGNKRIGLIHGDGASGSPVTRARQAFRQVDCIVFGHSHRPYNEIHGGVLMFNPGSPTDRRMMPMGSFGILHVTKDGIRGEHHYLEPLR